MKVISLKSFAKIINLDYFKIYNHIKSRHPNFIIRFNKKAYLSINMAKKITCELIIDSKQQISKIYKNLDEFDP